MPLYLDTRGRSKIAIAICGRCGRKFPYDELGDDPNYPGLRVCSEDRDNLDPWRLPARPSDDITLQYPRPDVSITTEGATPALFEPAVFGLTSINFATPWQPNTPYQKGDSITPLDVDLETTPLPQYWFVCIADGTSGPTPPKWPNHAGVTLHDGQGFLTDGHGHILTDDHGNPLTTGPGQGPLRWLCFGIYPN